jgi:hypothetical protein
VRNIQHLAGNSEERYLRDQGINNNVSKVGDSRMTASVGLFNMVEEASGCYASNMGSVTGEIDRNLFAKSSRPPTELTLSPAQWVPGTLTPDEKQPGREADHSRPFRA